MNELNKIIMNALLILLATTSLFACGGDDDSADTNNNTDNTPTTIECGGTTCTTATQYCVQTRVGSFDAPSSDFCLSKPASCTSCDCLNVTEDFEAQQSGANNCTGAIISCGSQNGAISASCTRSRL